MPTPYGQGRVYDPAMNTSQSQNGTTPAGNLNNTVGNPQNTVSQGGTPTGVPMTPTGRTNNTDVTNQAVGGNAGLQNVSIPASAPTPQNSPATNPPVTNTTNTTPVEVPNQTAATEPAITSATPNVSNAAANQILNNTQQQQNEVTIPLPSKKHLRKMTKEELIGIRSYLVHCYKEAMQNYDVFNVNNFAKECLKSHKNIPSILTKYYPDIITGDVKTVYNKLLDLADTKELKSQVKTSLNNAMKLLSVSTAWIGIVMSKKLTEWSYMFNDSCMQDLTIGKFFMIAALCASVVYLLDKVYKASLFSADEKFSPSIFENVTINESDAETKLGEYSSKEIPTNVLTINSLIMKCSVNSIMRLQALASKDLDKFQPIPINVLVLFEVCCSVVLLWKYVFGTKLKKAKTASAFLYECITPSLIESMDISKVKPTKDIFRKLDTYAKYNK